MKYIQFASFFMALIFLASCAVREEDMYAGFYYHTVMRVCDKPLFRADGGVNACVLERLLVILDDPGLSPLLRGAPVTAADFSYHVIGAPGCMSASGAVVIRLFEPIAGLCGVAHGHVGAFTAQWWQLVFRTADAGGDVLTLWMTQPYRRSHFSGTRYDRHRGYAIERFADMGEGGRFLRPIPEGVNRIHCDACLYGGLPPCDAFFFEANYGASVARANLLRDLSFLLGTFDVARYLVAPSALPGLWQGSCFQTGASAAGRFYAPGYFVCYNTVYAGATCKNNALGTAGLIWVYHPRFSMMNGKDGLSVAPFGGSWPHSETVPTQDDLLWLPSDFEVRTMGFDREAARFQTFIAQPQNPASALRWNYHRRETDPRRDYSQGRSGLWQLNGFDRAFPPTITEWVWLRSIDTFAIGNANTVCFSGNRYAHGANQEAGLRPALHLSVTCLWRNAC